MLGGRLACFSSALLTSLAALARSLRSPSEYEKSRGHVNRFFDPKLLPKFIENPSKILPNRSPNPSKIASKSLSGASWLGSSIFPRFWTPPGRLLAPSRRVLGPKLEASWPPKRNQKALEIDTKVDQKNDPSWKPLGIDFSWILRSKFDPSWYQNGHEIDAKMLPISDSMFD